MDTEIRDGSAAVGGTLLIAPLPLLTMPWRRSQCVRGMKGGWLGAEDEDLEQLDRILTQILEENRTKPS